MRLPKQPSGLSTHPRGGANGAEYRRARVALAAKRAVQVALDAESAACDSYNAILAAVGGPT